MSLALELVQGLEPQLSELVRESAPQLLVQEQEQALVSVLVQGSEPQLLAIEQVQELEQGSQGQQGLVQEQWEQVLVQDLVQVSGTAVVDEGAGSGVSTKRKEHSPSSTDWAQIALAPSDA